MIIYNTIIWLGTVCFAHFKKIVHTWIWTEKIEDIEILRFFEYNIKIKMVKLQSNSIAVDEKADIKKAEELLKKRHQIYK